MRSNGARIRLQLYDWGRWRKQSHGLGYGSGIWGNNDLSVDDDTECGHINAAWLRLRQVNSLQATVVQLFYEKGEAVKDMAIRCQVSNSTIRRELDKGEAKLESLIEYPLGAPQSTTEGF